MMLRHLKFEGGANRIDSAVNEVIRERHILTPDLGGKSGTVDVVDAVLKRI